MKISPKQILASTFGAVLAAIIASLFGVKGTIIGVAIGSAAATLGTTVAAQSIDHTRVVVKKVVEQAPTRPNFLRSFGQSQSKGTVASSSVEGPVERDPVKSGADTTPVGHEQLSAHVDEAPTDADTENAPRVRTFRWPILVGSVLAAFILALVVVTSVELIAGRPLASLFGVHGAPKSGTSIGGTISPPPGPATTTTTTSTSTTTTSTSTTTTSSTTTTFPGETTTSSTGSSSSTSSSTSTTEPQGDTTTTAGPSP